MKSRTQSIKDRLANRKREQEDANEIISNGFNSVIAKLMIQLEDKVNRGEIAVNDTNDIYKMLVMYNQVQELTGQNGGDVAAAMVVTVGAGEQGSRGGVIGADWEAWYGWYRCRKRRVS